MGEIKSVKVDNWGVFFLQKLQNFFNKTDYCDLTLQFRDNSQLKVHRLVLSACTDYFNVLEQKCEVVDDAIIMPSGLQADVVVPIVNFMYTGTLEFELKMYNRLLKTAKDMNMTVLLKLLEAHRRTMEMHPQKNQMPTSPKLRRKPAPSNTTSSTGGRSLIPPQQHRRIVVGDNIPQQPQLQQRSVQPSTYTRVTSSNMATTSLLPVKQQIGSTTFTRIKQEAEQDENVVGSGGHNVLKKPNQQQQHIVTSPFEQLRKGYNNNKRPAAATFISPPAKKPNLEDVKEFAEQQRMRKQIAAEFGDDGDYDAGIMDDDNIHNDDDDDDNAAASATPSSASAAVQTSTTQQQSDDPPGTTTIIVKHEGPDKPPTIVVKDSSNSKMNHAKIISEVLRQYPHLVNSNKNIKLKIMPNAGGQTQKIIVKKEPAEPEKSANVASTAATVGHKLPVLPKLEEKKVLPATFSAAANKTKPQSIQSGNIPANKVVVGSTTTQPAAASVPLAAPPQKRRIDSKTMHALIALGAENTTGPWLCLRCGRNGHPISIPSYRGFRRHLINTHKEAIDPSLCEHCGWRSASKRELHFHMQLDHKVKTNLYIFPECQLCQQMCIDSDALNQHLIDSHPDENKQQCIYCNKIFPEELQLYTHMKTFHKKQALEDGIIDYSDDENTNTELVFPPPLEEHEMDVDHAPLQQEQKKIKILSDISLPIASSIIKTDAFASATEQVLTTGESTTSVASDEYLHEHQEHVETKFVAADGSEVILTDEQRKEILSQLNQENEGSGIVMVLNESQHYAGGETQSEQGVISQDETSQATTATNDEHEEHDDSHIYNELKSHRQHATEEEDITTHVEPETSGDNEQNDEDEMEQAEEQGKNESEQQDVALDESKESTDNLEWAENLLSEHDMADEIPETTTMTCAIPQQVNKEEEPKDDEGDKSQEDISKKLKELAGDWSEDDEDDEEMLEEETTPQKDEGYEEEETPKKENAAGEEVEQQVDHDVAEPEKDLEGTEHKADTSETGNTTTEEFTSKSVQDQENSTEEKEIKEPAEEETESMVEDDVDLALKSLHKENDDEEDNSNENNEVEKKTAQTAEEESLAISTDTKEDNGVVLTATTTTDMDVDDKDKDSEKNSDSPQDEVKISTKKCEATTQAEDEETKKNLIDMLLSEHAATVEESKVESTDDSKTEKESDSKTESVKELEKETAAAADTQETTETKNDEEENIDEEDAASVATETSAQDPLVKDEFLDITPEKSVENKEDLPEAAGSSTETKEMQSPESIAKDSATSEERVKSLISEWGDDEDDDENEDPELKANL